MLILNYFRVFMKFIRDYPLKNDRKDTIIFSNRCNNIEKLTPLTPKKFVSRR